MRMVIVLLLLGILGFGTGIFGRMSSTAHVWPIGITHPHLMAKVSVVGAARNPGTPGDLVIG